MEEEFREIDQKNSWALVYQQIRYQSSNYDYSYKDAKKIENKNLNRYRDVNPYDHSRVRLERGDKDYINASLVALPAAKRAYILTQGPLPVTAGHFWLMVWEQKSKAVLMLNRIIEKNTVKCHQYWPLGSCNGGDDDMILNDVSLKVTFLKKKDFSHYTYGELKLTDLQSGQSRIVLHFHYTTWPDFGVPESPAAFLNFLMAVRESGALNTDVGPPIVHCSAGIGRSGTFCLVDSCLVLIEESGDSNSVNIQEILLEMRRYRMGLIQTPDQLRFSYLAIIEGAKKILNRENNKKQIANSLNSNENIDNKKDEDNLVNTDENDDTQESHQPMSEGDNEEIESDISEGINDKEYEIVEPPPLPPRLKSDLSPVSVKFPPPETENPTTKAIENSAGSHLNATVETKSLKPQSTVSTEESEYSQLRKRNREERIKKTNQLIQKIRRKQQEAEAWSRRKSLIKYSLGGLILLLGTGVLVYYIKS
ncbi:tyrosine-protein phosphatase non-receptor type 2 [Centruroides vittatus]|uniref:tyrosine-protein phosphatase non-receptor type 2 n=1 Tax=Centruroides vittatus TaxID=120091 RepID=UPI0035108F28